MPLSPPKLFAPVGACDTHMHIYEPGYEMAPTALLAPPHAPLADYLKVRKRLGIERTVVVQPTTYGTDNRCTLAAMAALGDSARGVVTVDTSISDQELADLTALGVRGVRFHMLPGGALPWEIMGEMAARVANHGWHVQVQLDGRTLPERAAVLQDLPVTVVIDHMGRFEGPVAPEHECFVALRRLVAKGAWVKLSGPYYSSAAGPPTYPDAGKLARLLIAEAPEHMVWASNWPHPGENPSPDDAMMLDTLLAWIDDDHTRHRILVENPAVLYDFQGG